MKWRGKSLQGVNPEFRAKVAAAAQAAGASYIYVISGKRTKANNTGVSNSNHLYGHAIDGYAVVGGRKIPLGTLLKTSASSYGLRSGDQPGFYLGKPDVNHVDDGYNVNHGAPLPSTSTTPPRQQHPQTPQSPQTPQQAQDTSTPDYALQNSIAQIPQLPGPPVAGIAMTGDQPGAPAQPLAPYSQTWQLIAANGQVSPDTLRLAQLAGYGDGSASQ